MDVSSTGRRAEYAALTRKAIVEAARELFATQGYFATTVHHLAERARVSAATVYTACGGKQGLIETLVEEWSTAPVIAERTAVIEAARDPAEVIRLMAEGVTAMRITHGDIIRTVCNVAPHDPEVAKSLAVATRRYRAALGAVAVHLENVGGLREGIDAASAEDTLWFYFGYTGLQTLVDDNGWSYEQARDWLAAQALRELCVTPA